MYEPGAIIVPTSGILRHVQFVADLIDAMRIAPTGTEVIFQGSGYVVQNLNRGLIRFMEQEHLKWAWLQADDHRFSSKLLPQLLAHEFDIVAPLIVRRATPYEYVFGDETEDVDEFSGRTYPAYKSTARDELPSIDEPFKVEIAGSAGMLVRRQVFEAIGYPYFETTDGLKLNEDIVFCKKARAAGFDIHVDPQAHMGHIVSTLVWPI